MNYRFLSSPFNPTSQSSRSERYPYTRYRQLYNRAAGVGGRHSAGTHSVHRRYTVCARRVGRRCAGWSDRQERRVCVGEALLSVRTETRHLLTTDTLDARAVEWRCSRWHLQSFDDHITGAIGHRVSSAVLLFGVPEQLDGVHAPQEFFK